MIRKVGIITHYHQSTNYGGNLQAYALCKALRELGTESYQIQIPRFLPYEEKPIDLRKRLLSALRKSPKYHYKRIIDKFSRKLHQKKVALSVSKRIFAFERFHYDLIPHSENVYSHNNISDSLEKYDIFITGSDQVWNPIWYTPAMRLDFVPSEKPKFSYAASVSANSLTLEEESVFKNSLSDYIGVSVRESDAVSLLTPLSPIKPVCSLDPTLLLSRAEWDEIANERIIQDRYMFCYFLGMGKNLRRLARRYAKKHGLKIVAIPYLLNCYNRYDKKYSDILMEGISPEKFISLIKYADVVFTDSFHASVFSIIYERDFYTFRRAGHEGMSARLQTLTEMFNIEQRFCNTDEKETLSYIEGCEAIDYSHQEKYNQKKEESLAYLQEMLEKSERMLNKNEI